MCNFCSSVVCTGKRCKPLINMNYYTTNPLDSNHNVYNVKHGNVLPLSRRRGESAGRICRTRVALMISSCIERTQGLDCEFEIFTVPKFPPSWNCDQAAGILTFFRNQCRSVWKSTPEDYKRHFCNFGHPAYIGPWLCLLSNIEGKRNINFFQFHGSVHHIIINEKHQLDATSVSIYFT